jgi:hypothetical protein
MPDFDAPSTTFIEAQAMLCDADGVVRHGRLHHGQDYPCTGDAHVDGYHYTCINPLHRRQAQTLEQRVATLEAQYDALAQRVATTEALHRPIR